MKFGTLPFVSRRSRKLVPDIAPKSAEPENSGWPPTPAPTAQVTAEAKGNLKAAFQNSVDEWMAAMEAMENAQIEHFKAIYRIGGFGPRFAWLLNDPAPTPQQIATVEEDFARAHHALKTSHETWKSSMVAAVQKGREMDHREKLVQAHAVANPGRFKL